MAGGQVEGQADQFTLKRRVAGGVHCMAQALRRVPGTGDPLP